jgi:hypothetical protein
LKDMGAASEPREIDMAYQAAYDRATVIWIRSPVTFYIIRRDPNTWMQYQEDTIPDRSYFDENYLRTLPLFRRVPKDRFPPYTGLAVVWQKDPDHWFGLLGWRRWHRQIKSVMFQTFEKGVVIGPMLFGADAESGLVYVLYDDKTWKTNAVRAIPKRKELLPVWPGIPKFD